MSRDARRSPARLAWAWVIVPLPLVAACESSTFDATLADTVGQAKLEGSVTSISSDGEGSVDLQLGGGARQTSDAWLCPVYGDDLRMFMGDAEMKVSSRGGYSAGQPAVLKSPGWPSGCGALEGYVNFQGRLRSDPSSPPEPPPDQTTLTFRIVDRSGTFSFDVASPTTPRTLSLTAPVGGPITVGEAVTLQWEPATDTLLELNFTYCTFGPPSGGIPNPCLVVGGGATAGSSARIEAQTITGAALQASGGFHLPTTLTFLMPSVPAGDGQFRIVGPGALAGVVGCPFGGGCEFGIEPGDMLPMSLTVAATVGQ